MNRVSSTNTTQPLRQDERPPLLPDSDLTDLTMFLTGLALRLERLVVRIISRPLIVRMPLPSFTPPLPSFATPLLLVRLLLLSSILPLTLDAECVP